MEKFDSRDDLRYRALADIAVAITEGLPIDLAARRGLAAAIKYMELGAGAIILWDEGEKVTVEAVEANIVEYREILLESEDSVLKTLRRDFKLRQAYMEFGGNKENSLFSIPLEIVGQQFGALIGIKEGKAHLHKNDSFLQALAAVLALAARQVGAIKGMSADEVDKKIVSERNAAKIEIAIAVNHYINNPLTALLGNLQLLNLKHQNMPEDLQKRLEVIESSARQINEVTKKLMSASQSDSIDYINGIKMTDFFGDDKSDDTSEDDEKDLDK